MNCFLVPRCALRIVLGVVVSHLEPLLEELFTALLQDRAAQLQGLVLVQLALGFTNHSKSCLQD